MEQKRRKGWIVGVVLISIMCAAMFILLIAVISETSDEGTPTMSVEEMSAHCYRSSDLFRAGIYYTDKALTTDPKETDYTTWKSYVNKADEYWGALEYELNLIEGYADTEGFQKSFADTELKSFNLLPIAYAIDSAQVLRAYNGAKAGSKLKAVAEFLGRDMKYARAALKVADGEITSESWNNYGDAAMQIEQGLRVAKTAGQGAALIVGAATGGAAVGAAAVLGDATLVVSGASLMWQATDDGAFIMMGDDYKSNEFVANLSKVSDFVAPITFVGDMLTMDFASESDKILAVLSVGETLRGLFQDGKIAGINLKGQNGTVTTMTPDELVDYRLAKENGQKLPGEIEALLKVLDGDKEEGLSEDDEQEPNEPKPNEPDPNEPQVALAEGVAQFVGTWTPKTGEGEELEGLIIIGKDGSVMNRIILEGELIDILEGEVMDTQLSNIEYKNGEYHIVYLMNRTITIGDDGNLHMHTTKEDLVNSLKGVYEGLFDDAQIRELADNQYDEVKTQIWIPAQDEEETPLEGTWKSVMKDEYVVTCYEGQTLEQTKSYAGNENIGVSSNSEVLIISDNGDYSYTYNEHTNKKGIEKQTLTGNGLEWSDEFSIQGLKPVIGADGHLYLPTSGGEGHNVFIKQ